MVVAVALFEIHIEFAESLKDKRMVVKSLRDKLAAHFHISVAEVGLQDVHQRARMGLSLVSSDRTYAESVMAKIENWVESNTDATLAGWTTELLDFDEDVAL